MPYHILVRYYRNARHEVCETGEDVWAGVDYIMNAMFKYRVRFDARFSSRVDSRPLSGSWYETDFLHVVHFLQIASEPQILCCTSSISKANSICNRH